MDTTSNVGKHWLPEEDIMLIKELTQRLPVQTIAVNHKCTPEEICAHFTLMAANDCEAGIGSIEGAADYYNVQKDEIQRILDKKQKDKDLQKTKSQKIDIDTKLDTILDMLANITKRLDKLTE